MRWSKKRPAMMGAKRRPFLRSSLKFTFIIRLSSESRSFCQEIYPIKYAAIDVATNTTIIPIVILWRIFSGPRRSNFPKSFEFGMIESPDPFACIPTRRMMIPERRERSRVIKMSVKSAA
jgi:hypothetical protein